MLYSSSTSFLCIAVFVFFKKILLYLILLCSNGSDARLRMVGILKDCNHVEISLIYMAKIFLKSLFVAFFNFPPLSLLHPFSLRSCNTCGLLAEENCSDSSRELFVCSEEHPEDPLGCTRSPLIRGNLFLPDVFPTATFLQCPSSLCSVRINIQDPRLWHTAFPKGV